LEMTVTNSAPNVSFDPCVKRLEVDFMLATLSTRDRAVTAP
jgi:hypothetical protein